jgi:hypothetical protein
LELDVNELEWEELMGLTTRLKPNEERKSIRVRPTNFKNEW